MPTEENSKKLPIAIMVAIIAAVATLSAPLVTRLVSSNPSPLDEILIEGEIVEDKVLEGEVFTFKWKVLHADKCLINYGNGSEEIAHSGSKILTAKKQMNIIITGSAKGKQTKQHEMSVKVIPKAPEKTTSDPKPEAPPKRVDLDELNPEIVKQH